MSSTTLTGSRPASSSSAPSWSMSARGPASLMCLWPVRMGLSLIQDTLGMLDVGNHMPCGACAGVPGHASRRHVGHSIVIQLRVDWWATLVMQAYRQNPPTLTAESP